MKSKPKVRYVVDWKNKGSLEWHKGVMPCGKRRAKRLVGNYKALLGKNGKYRIRPVKEDVV